MALQDHLSMLLTKIRNGQKYKSSQIAHFDISFLRKIIEVMYHQGYLQGYYIQADKIVLLLKYIQNKPVIKTIKRISKPSKKIFWTIEDLKNQSCEGTFILSTNKGVISDKTAISLGIGGEVLVHII